MPLCLFFAFTVPQGSGGGEQDAAAAGTGVRLNASAWQRVTYGALQLFSTHAPDQGARLAQALSHAAVPSLMYHGAHYGGLPAAGVWDLAAAIAHCGWQSLRAPEAVSYTHSTLPTNREVEFVAVLATMTNQRE